MRIALLDCNRPVQPCHHATECASGETDLALVSESVRARRCKLLDQLTCLCSQSCAQHALPTAGPIKRAAAALAANTWPQWAQIWNRVKAEVPDAGEGLNRAQFACALRLVATAQSQGMLPLGAPPWQETSGLPAPLPRLAPQPRRSGPSTCACCLQRC